MQASVTGRTREPAWKLARVYYWLGSHAPEQERRAFLEKGIETARHAVSLKPDAPEGHFWIAANMGTYNAGSNPTGGIVGTGTIDGTNNTTTGAYYVLQNLITAGLTSQSVAGKDFASDVHSGNVHFVLNPYTAELVRQSYLAAHGTAMPEIAIGLAGLQNNVQGGFRFPGWGVPMIIQNFVPNNFVAMIRNGNAVIAFDALSDLTSMEMWQADDHQTLRWLMAFKMGVGWNELTGNAIKYFGATT